MIENIVRDRFRGSIPPDDHRIQPIFPSTASIQIPGHTVEIRLHITTALRQGTDRFPENLLPFPGRPEIGIIRIVWIVMPPVPGKSGFCSGIFAQLQNGRNNRLRQPPVPAQTGDLPHRGKFLFLRDPMLLKRPAPVQTRRFIPAAFKRRDPAGKRQFVCGPSRIQGDQMFPVECQRAGFGQCVKTAFLHPGLIPEIKQKRSGRRHCRTGTHRDHLRSRDLGFRREEPLLIRRDHMVQHIMQHFAVKIRQQQFPILRKITPPDVRKMDILHIRQPVV